MSYIVCAERQFQIKHAEESQRQATSRMHKPGIQATHHLSSRSPIHSLTHSSIHSSMRSEVSLRKVLAREKCCISYERTFHLSMLNAYPYKYVVDAFKMCCARSLKFILVLNNLIHWLSKLSKWFTTSISHTMLGKWKQEHISFHLCKLIIIV